MGIYQFTMLKIFKFLSSGFLKMFRGLSPFNLWILVLSLPQTSLFLPLSASCYLTPLTLYCQGYACFILPLCFAFPLFLILECLVFSARLFCVCSVSLSIPQRVFISTINKKRLKTHLLRNFNHHFFFKKMYSYKWLRVRKAL